jgi:hypothetical protein
MDSNLINKEKTFITMGIIRDVVSKIPKIIEKKKVYEVIEKEYDIHRGQYITCNWQIKNLYPKENIKYSGFRNPHAEIYSTQLPSNLNRILSERGILKFKIDRLYDRMCKAKSEYDDAFNLLVSYFNKYKESELKYILDYLDIETNLGEKNIKYITIILESIISDFEILENHQLQLPQNTPYKGTISLAETLVNQIKECETKIEKYNVFEEKLEFLNEEYKTATKLIEEKENIKNKIESVFINKLLKRDELEDLKFDLKSLYMTLQNILTEFDLYVNGIKILLNEKSEMCLQCIKNKLCIDLILDRLGVKSLRELINKLNIVIPKTDDNYFNEKEEMKKIIKNWFEEALKQIIIENELENSKFEEHINEGLSINKKIFENEKHLINK